MGSPSQGTKLLSSFADLEYIFLNKGTNPVELWCSPFDLIQSLSPTHKLYLQIQSHREIQLQHKITLGKHISTYQGAIQENKAYTIFKNRHSNTGEKQRISENDGEKLITINQM